MPLIYILAWSLLQSRSGFGTCEQACGEVMMNRSHIGGLKSELVCTDAPRCTIWQAGVCFQWFRDLLKTFEDMCTHTYKALTCTHERMLQYRYMVQMDSWDQPPALSYTITYYYTLSVITHQPLHRYYCYYDRTCPSLKEAEQVLMFTYSEQDLGLVFV